MDDFTGFAADLFLTRQPHLPELSSVPHSVYIELFWSGKKSNLSQDNEVLVFASFEP